MKNKNQIVLSLFLFTYLIISKGDVLAATTDNNQGNINSQEVQQDYRAFLQKLKQLNSQYKQVTGQMADVMKQEGVPTWDAGDADKKIDALFPKQDTMTVPDQGVTITETAQDLTVSIDLPGIKKDTLKLAVQNSKKLSVSAEKKADVEPKKIEKSIDLPSTVDTKGTKAAYEDGVLTVKLTKTSTQEVVIPVR